MSSYIEKVSSKEAMVLPKMSKNLQISLAAMTHLAEGLFLNTLFTLKAENSLTCLVGTRIPTVSMMEWQLILPLKTLITNKAWSGVMALSS
jgi:hypothetical protein